MARPRVVLSVASSVDGYIDDTTPDRLILSGAADLDRVDGERAAADAILVGAGTVRSDDPRLLVRSERRIAERVAAGRPAQPTKVVLSTSGDLDPASRFFTTGETPKLVYLRSGATAPDAVAAAATVVPAGDPVDPHRVLADLHARGVRTLLVEGGTAMHTLFLTAGLADELQLVVAPLFVGDPDAPRLVGPGRFPHGAGNRMRLVEVRAIEDVVLVRYRLGDVPADGSDVGPDGGRVGEPGVDR